MQKIPKVLWISIVSLLMMMLGNLVSGVIYVNYFAIIIGFVDGLLIWGIIKGFRWAFWTITVLVFGGLFYIIIVGSIIPIIASAFFDSLLFVPVYIYREHFKH